MAIWKDVWDSYGIQSLDKDVAINIWSLIQDALH